MINQRLLLTLLFSSVLVACSDSVPNRPDPELPPIIETPGTQIDIQNTLLPIHETFAGITGPADHLTGTGGGYDFFNPAYQPLATCAADDDVDPLTCTHNLEDGDGNPYILVDTLSSFYYPTCCLFNTFPTDPLDPAYDPDLVGQQRRPPLEDPPSYDDGLDFRLKVADNKMAISNARFTIGQILSDLTSSNAVDRKINTSGNTPGADVVRGGWGELDLTQPYRISFCLMDNGVVTGGGGGSGNLEVYVDNNSGGNQANSFHAQLSLLLRETTTNFVPGNRIVVEVPGQTRQVDNSGNQVGNILALSTNQTGTQSSFFQLRVSSGSYAVINDLVIEYQSDRTVGQLVTDLPCNTDTAFWVQPPPSGITVTPGFEQLTASWNLYTSATGYEVVYNTTNSMVGATPVIVPPASTSVTITGLTNGTPYYVFVRAVLPAGEFSGWSSGVEGIPVEPTEPPEAPTGVMGAALDGEIDLIWDSTFTASGYDIAYNTTGVAPDPLDAPDVADVSGLNVRLSGLSNGTLYHIYVRAKNIVGDGPYSAAKMVTPTAPVAAFWTGQNLDLFGTVGNVPNGTLTENTSTDVTFDMEGGNAAASGFRIFFAHRQITGDFKLAGRFTSASANPAFGTVNNNAYRFGLLTMENLNVAATYADLARWAAVEHYLVTTTPTYTGSAAEKADSAATSRGRGDQAQQVGDLIRVSRTGDSFRTEYSADNGATWNAARSGTFTGAAVPNTWYIGIYGTHHATSGTGTYVFDDIRIYQ